MLLKACGPTDAKAGEQPLRAEGDTEQVDEAMFEIDPVNEFRAAVVDIEGEGLDPIRLWNGALRASDRAQALLSLLACPSVHTFVSVREDKCNIV